MKKQNAFIRFSELPILEAIRQGFIYIVPIIVIGATALAIVNLPIPQFQDFMHDIFGGRWEEIGAIMGNATLQIISVATAVAMSYSVASRYRKTEHVKPVYFAIGALACYMVVMPPDPLGQIVLTVKQGGSASMFLAILISVTATKLLMFFYNIYDRILPAKEHRFSSNYVVKTAFHFLPPLALCMLIFLAANFIMHHSGIAGLISDGADSFFRGLFGLGKYISGAVMILIVQVCWFFGIHGGNIFLDFVGGAMNNTTSVDPIFTELPRAFFDIFVFSGGSGATLAMLPALFIFGKSTERKIAKTSLFPGLFNINEPIIYGLPIVLNPYYLIPFVLVPIIITLVSAFAVTVGLVPMPEEGVLWSTPMFISGYMATGSISGALLQAVNFVIAFAIYAPYVKLSAKMSEQKYRENFDRLTQELSYLQNGKQNGLMSQSDDLGNLARFLAREIGDSLRKDDGDLYLLYQPKTVHSGKACGAEALLRWNHPMFGYVSPMTVLTVSDEAKLSANLGRWIISKAFRDMQSLDSEGCDQLRISINLSPIHLESDEGLSDFIRREADRYGITFDRLDFELTENAIITKTDIVDRTLSDIRSFGADISIDDFGMGHSSLKYIYDLYANVVKLDASLVQAITEDEGRKQIVKSIIDLCKILNVRLIAEGAETKEQADLLYELGCKYFQGYYYSKPLAVDAFRSYVEAHGVCKI